MTDTCKGDLVARERRNLLTTSERVSLSHHLVTCASCRLARQIGADFDGIGALRPGDGERIARISAGVLRGVAPPRRTALRVRATALLIAAAIGLLAAGAFGARVWIRRTSVWLAPIALQRPPSAEAPPPPVIAPASLSAQDDSTASDARHGDSSSPSRSSSSPSMATDEIPASAIFANANQSRHDGAVENAITLYQRLEQKFPASPEAHLSRVSLGRLLLERGYATRALEQFDRYLSRPGGDLAAEALAGRARALAMLDRKHEERDTWNRLLREFPGSVYAVRARQRLAELD